MENKLGRRIELLIYSKGFDSVKSFARYIEEKNPQRSVALQTLYNVIKGKKAETETIMIIAESLELPIDILTNENMYLIDEFLEREILPIKMGENFNNRTRLLAIEKVKKIYDVSNLFCPSIIGDWFGTNEGIHMSTMPEIEFYVPLSKMNLVCDFRIRIAGDMEWREDYILKQSENLYKRIPNIPAKRYVDNHVLTYKLRRKDKLNESEIQELEALEGYWKSKQSSEDYEQYLDILQRWHKFSQNPVVCEILKQTFPEIYS